MINFIIDHGGVPGMIFCTLVTLLMAQVLMRLGI
jgi:hypothetical protein